MPNLNNPNEVNTVHDMILHLRHTGCSVCDKISFVLSDLEKQQDANSQPLVETVMAYQFSQPTGHSPYHLQETHVEPEQFYRHYKGGIYEIVMLALNEEDEETMVVYKNWEGQMFVRKLSVFEEVWTSPVPAKRFTRISDLEALRALQDYQDKQGVERI